MLSTIKPTSPKSELWLKQPAVGKLIRELRQLTGLTQEQFAAMLGVTFGTVNRWENSRMQPSPLALMQIRAVLTNLGSSSSKTLRDTSKQLLEQYFAEGGETR
jgi:putative transcriptional regulator